MRLLGCALFAFAALGVSAADVYRSVDAQGNVTYSDRPQDGRAERVAIAAPGPARRPTPPAPPPMPQPEAAEAAPAAEPETPPAPSPETRARNCEIARERVVRYSESYRLFRSTPDGGRQYLSDAEIDQVRAQAAADVETWCN